MLQKVNFYLLILLLSFSTNTINAQEVDLNQVFTKYQIVNVSSESIVNDISTMRNEMLSMNLLGHKIQLFHSNIISPNYTLRVASEDGIRVIKTKTALPMQGYTNKGGRVSLTFNTNFIHGYIKDGSETYFIEPLSNFIKGENSDQYIYYNTKDVKDNGPKTCGVTKMHEKDREVSREAQGSQRMAGQCYEADWAFANDWLMFQSYGSVVGVENHAIGVANNVATNYDDEFEDEIRFNVSEQFVSQCNSCDPWSNTTDASSLLSNFRSWGPSGFSSSHDIGSLWTDRDFDGSTIGIAYVGAVCTNSRYNCLQDFTNNANTKRVMVAHELGHNFDADHDASGSPYIMAPSVQSTTSWSSASISNIQNYYNSIGCLSSCSSGSAPSASFSVIFASQCAPASATFTDESTGNVTSRVWTFQGGSPTTSTSQNPIVSYASPGLYTVTLTAYNGGLSNTISDVIEIFEEPFVDFNFSINENEVEFENLSVNGNTYLWDFGDGNTSTEYSPVHTYVDDGFYPVTLEVTNGCGSVVQTYTVSVFSQPVPDFSSTFNSVCTPQTVDYFSQSSSNSEDFFWEFAGGVPSTSTLENPSVLYETPGTYTTKLTVSNPQGTVTKEVIDYMTVYQSPIASFTNTNNGTQVIFTNTSLGGTSYLWNFGDGNSDTAKDPVHTYAVGGNYDVSLTVYSLNCPNVDITKTITISLLPQAEISVAGSTEGCTSFDVQFEDQSSSNPTSWLWSFEGGNPTTSTEQNPFVTYNTTGSFDVTLTVTNSVGSGSTTLTNYINVNTTPTPNYTFTKSGSNVNFTNTSTNANSYSWDFGDGNTSTAISPSHDYNQEGNWTATLTATNGCGSTTTTQSYSTIISPVSAFSFNKNTVCRNDTVQFTDDSQNTVSTRLWTFEGGSPETSTLQNPIVVYPTSGTYDVTLSVSNAEGTDAMTTTDAITVLEQPVADISSSKSGNIVTYTYNGNTNDVILWTLPDNTTSSSNSVSFTASENGNYEATIVVNNQCGQASAMTSQTVTAFPISTITINQNNGCADFTTTFMADEVENGIYNWIFEGGTPATSIDQNPTVTYNDRGIFDVTLTTSNNLGSDISTMVDAITIEAEPTSEFTINYDGIQLTTNNTSQFATSFLWDFGNGKTSTMMNPIHQYQNNGTYTVSLTATNSCGSVTTTKEVEVFILVPAIAYTMSALEGCAPLEVTFTNTSENDPTSFSWTFEGGEPSTSTEENPVVTYTNAGTYDVVVMMTNAAGSSTSTEESIVVVLDVPTPSFDFTIVDGTVNFIDASENATERVWDFGDTSTSTETSPTYTYTKSGDYLVTLTTTNECGSSSVSKTISVVISSVENIDFLNKFAIYPNPFTSIVKIEAEFSRNVSGVFSIIDNLGRQIASKEFTNSLELKESFNLSELPSGLYYIKMQSDNQLIVKKLIKE